ncbi:NAD(P)-binding protein [Schizophyllum commune H4-8]|uniref:NAD(P)-binding protein n=1 Tax=Schizophyllum commune (strain H4-8 / FGSC 9210) TaxID=578458 RepID=UPI00215FDAE1|nr:NAD(P)-binding protein [Schizophyllum commune H4-8]KAI5888270.1 NAD(P)-binding protein [Schizophyllum commune H4-8]
MSLTRRIAVVTGAARGIGRAIALRLADDGHDVAVNDLPSAHARLEGVKSEVEDRGRRALMVPADVTSAPDVERMVDQTAAHFGRLDVMVANAGVAVYKNLVDTTVEDWHKAHGVNGLGIFLCYKYAALKMQELGNNSGCIIGASSALGRTGTPKAGVYCQTKFGVRGLTQALAQELATTGITVNSYCPGWTDTEMIRDVAEGSGDVNAFYAAITAQTPTGHLGQPDDTASAVSFLASPQAHFITGQGIDVNGGMVMN